MHKVLLKISNYSNMVQRKLWLILVIFLVLLAFVVPSMAQSNDQPVGCEHLQRVFGIPTNIDLEGLLYGEGATYNRFFKIDPAELDGDTEINLQVVNHPCYMVNTVYPGPDLVYATPHQWQVPILEDVLDGLNPGYSEGLSEFGLVGKSARENRLLDRDLVIEKYNGFIVLYQNEQIISGPGLDFPGADQDSVLIELNDLKMTLDNKHLSVNAFSDDLYLIVYRGPEFDQYGFIGGGSTVWRHDGDGGEDFKFEIIKISDSPVALIEGVGAEVAVYDGSPELVRSIGEYGLPVILDDCRSVSISVQSFGDTGEVTISALSEISLSTTATIISLYPDDGIKQVLLEGEVVGVSSHCTDQ